MMYGSLQDGVDGPSPHNEHVNEGFLSDSLRVLVGAERVQTGNDTATESAMSDRTASKMLDKGTEPLISTEKTGSDGFWMVQDGRRRVKNPGQMRLPRVQKGNRRRKVGNRARKRGIG